MQSVTHRDASEQPIKKQIQSEFLVLSAQILPSIINKEKDRNMMGKGETVRSRGRGGRGGGVGGDQGFSREVKARMEVFLWLFLYASVILPQKERKNLIIELLKISLLAELHLHV